MTVHATDTFRPVGPGNAIPNGYVVPYYLPDRKVWISVARVDDRLYAFDDLCRRKSPRKCDSYTCHRVLPSIASSWATGILLITT